MPARGWRLRGQPGATADVDIVVALRDCLRLRGAGVEVKCEVGQRAGIADAYILKVLYIVVKNTFKKWPGQQSLSKTGLKTLANAFGWLIGKELIVEETTNEY